MQTEPECCSSSIAQRRRHAWQPAYLASFFPGGTSAFTRDDDCLLSHLPVLLQAVAKWTQNLYLEFPQSKKTKTKTKEIPKTNLKVSQLSPIFLSLCLDA